LLWLIYLSLTTVGREFLGFQWDTSFWKPAFGHFPCAAATAASNETGSSAVAHRGLAAALALVPAHVRIRLASSF